MSAALTRLAVIIATLLGLSLFVPKYSFAQEATGPQAPLSDSEFMSKAAQGIREVAQATKGEDASRAKILLSFLLLASQLLIQLTKTRLFGRVFHMTDERGKLTLVAVCTVMTTLLPLVLAGVPIDEALLNGGVLTAIMIAGHQVFKHFVKKKKKKKKERNDFTGGCSKWNR